MVGPARQRAYVVFSALLTVLTVSCSHSEDEFDDSLVGRWSVSTDEIDAESWRLAGDTPPETLELTIGFDEQDAMGVPGRFGHITTSEGCDYATMQVSSFDPVLERAYFPGMSDCLERNYSLDLRFALTGASIKTDGANLRIDHPSGSRTLLSK